eukprot:TRINITY_DN54755_c0_g1_i1.p1 TRINITY_DN54755_c0_g1~~TRINITY_DN54755_c0_g1_i1.p1  ORF type:complete len:377 (+),score=48.92 TRINITY_DN54755_c0_g1_i1:54-1133(+)
MATFFLLFRFAVLAALAASARVSTPRDQLRVMGVALPEGVDDGIAKSILVALQRADMDAICAISHERIFEEGQRRVAQGTAALVLSPVDDETDLRIKLYMQADIEKAASTDRHRRKIPTDPLTRAVFRESQIVPLDGSAKPYLQLRMQDVVKDLSAMTAHGFEACVCRASDGKRQILAVETPSEEWVDCNTECPKLCSSNPECIKIATENGEVDTYNSYAFNETNPNPLPPPPLPLSRHVTHSYVREYVPTSDGGTALVLGGRNTDPTRKACVCAGRGRRYIWGHSSNAKGIYTWGSNGCDLDCPNHCEDLLLMEMAECIEDRRGGAPSSSDSSHAFSAETWQMIAIAEADSEDSDADN